MKFALHRILPAVALSGFALVAGAQTPPPPPPPPPPAAAAAPAGSGMAIQPRAGGWDPARMQARMQERRAKKLAEFKAILQVTPAQEGAWNTFAAAFTPPPGMQGQRHERGEFERMTTPQRIDAMRAMRAQRQAHMDRIGDATKTFYAQLSPAQQKVFDIESLRMMRHMGGRHGGMDRHHG